jgi:S-adenosylmethionine:tRNA ribosyltransferase-isomerase
MLTKELDYELPPELIAQSPVKQRDQSKLLLYNRNTEELSHHSFNELPDLLPPSLSIFRNNVSVLKARIYGKRPNGGNVECLLLKPEESLKNTWKCLVKPGAKTLKSKKFGWDGEYSAEVIEKTKSDEYLVKFILYKDPDPASLAQRIGNLPLPPYVRRPVDSSDEIRYQTVYAKDEHRSAVAAPTAGLHFTPNIFSKLELLGHEVHDLTLSVGIGTFRPIETENIDDHTLHCEKYILSPETQRVLLARTRKHLAIGTTSVRSIEHYLSNFKVTSDQELTLETNLFIKPPYHFSGTNHLLTNFHLPGSTLLCLVAAFLKPGKTTGLKTLKKIYAHAIEKKYRFFSYGDSMLIL